MQKKDNIDSFFDSLDRVVDGAAAVLKDMPGPDDDDDTPVEIPATSKRVIDVRQLPEGNRGPRQIVLGIQGVSKRKNGGVSILAETPVHEVVVLLLSEADWKKLCDNADWLRSNE